MNKNAKTILENLIQAGHEAYLVGGCVRDALLNRPVKDIDITTSATPEEVMKIFPNNIPTGLQHGTVTVKMNGELFEVTTFRKEGQYSDSRRPDSVVFVTSLEKDLQRRDFTINAMAMTVEGEILDYFNGQGDIKNGIIRTVGDPHQRLSEDALRILRAVRFAVRYGFNIEEKTFKACEVMNHTLNNISKERITQELREIFSHKNADLGKYNNILKVLFNRGKLFNEDTLEPVRNKNNDWIQNFARFLIVNGLISENGMPIDEATEKLHLTNKEKHSLKILTNMENLNKYNTRELLNLYGLTHTLQIRELTYGDVGIEQVKRLSKLPYRIKDLPINGNDLIKLGYQGEDIGKALNKLMQKQLNTKHIYIKEELINLLNE